MRTLHTNVIRRLDLGEPLAGASRFVSAASGLAVVGDDFAVAADDAHHLALFACGRTERGRTVRLVDGDLPQDPADRKRRKPDFEALTVMPATAGFPHGALLVVGSGSTPTRDLAVLVPLDASGSLGDRVHVRPLSSLYAPWRNACGEINVETAFVLGTDLVMVSRGHGAAPDNHVARFELDALGPWLDGVSTDPIAPARLTALRLDDLDGVPLSITDGAAHPAGGWVFSAVAEDTRDSYNDGALVGAGVGTMNAADALTSLRRLDVAAKVEGIVAARTPSGDVELNMVTDADDPEVAASLLAATLPDG